MNLENKLIKIALDGNFIYETKVVRKEWSDSMSSFYSNHLKERKELACLNCPQFSEQINNPKTYINHVLTLVECSLIDLKYKLGLKMSNESLKLKV